MDHFSTKEISYSLFFVISACLRITCGSDDFKIYRRKLDVFTNLHYDSGSDQCSKYFATCFNEKCAYCRCLKQRSTFLVNDYISEDGKCKSGKHIGNELGRYELF